MRTSPLARPSRRWGLRSAGGWGLIGLMVAHFTNDLYANFLPVYLPLLREELRLSLTQVALLSTVFTTTASFAQLGFGLLADRLARANFVLWGPLLTGGFMSLVGILPGYEAILLALGLSALGTAMFHPQATALSGRLFEGRKGWYVSLFISAGMLGFSLGPALMAPVLNTFSLKASALALLPLAALGAVLLKLLQRAPLALRAHPHAYPHPNPHPDSGNSPSSPPPGGTRPRGRGQGGTALALLWGLVVLRHTVLLSFLTFLVILLQGRGFGYLAGSFALVGFLLVSVPSGLLGGTLSDRFGRWSVTAITLWVGFLAMVGFLATSGWPSLALLLLGGGFLSASNPVIVAHAQELLPRSAGTASALVMGVAWGVSGLLVTAVGALGDAWGIERALSAITLGAFGVTALLTLLGARLLRA